MENQSHLHKASTPDAEDFVNKLRRAAGLERSPDNQHQESASAHERGSPLSLREIAAAMTAGQSGGGGDAECPLPAPAPALTIREAEAFWADGEDAFQGSGAVAQGSWVDVRCTCGGVDVPGVGRGHLATCPAAFPSRAPSVSLRLTPADVVALDAARERNERREELLIQLMFAAKDLALGLQQPSGCEMCGGIGERGFLATPVGRHMVSCRAERVVEIVGALYALTLATGEGGSR